MLKTINKTLYQTGDIARFTLRFFRELLNLVWSFQNCLDSVIMLAICLLL